MFDLNEHTIPLVMAMVFCVLMYLDSAINSTPRTGRTYAKSFVIVYAVCYFSIYLFVNKGVGQKGGKVIGNIRHECFIGNPNF